MLCRIPKIIRKRNGFKDEVEVQVFKFDQRCEDFVMMPNVPQIGKLIRIMPVYLRLIPSNAMLDFLARPPQRNLR